MVFPPYEVTEWVQKILFAAIRPPIRHDYHEFFERFKSIESKQSEAILSALEKQRSCSLCRRQEVPCSPNAVNSGVTGLREDGHVYV